MSLLIEPVYGLLCYMHLMVEVLRKNWEFILYEGKGTFYLFVVNGEGTLNEVTYELNAMDVVSFEQQGTLFLTQKVKEIRHSFRQAARLHFSSLETFCC